MRPGILLLFALAAAACEATMPPPPTAPPAPPASGKQQLDYAQQEQARQPVQKGIEACLSFYRIDGAEAILEVAPSGEVTSAKIFRTINVSASRCLQRAVKLARFPSFEGPPMKVVWTLSMPKSETPAAK